MIMVWWKKNWLNFWFCHDIS